MKNKAREEILRLKDEGWVLMRFQELRETLRSRLSGGLRRLDHERLLAGLTLMASPGVV